MAETKPSSTTTTTSPKGAGILAKRVQRQLSRAQERVLQKLGKSDETRDEEFDRCVQDLSEQMSDGSRIYKDLKAYFNAVKGFVFSHNSKLMRDASTRLSQSLFDAYESDWNGLEELGAVVEGENLLWNDYEVKTLDQAVRTMESYMSQFPDVKERVAKRNRKLVDYDSTRHHLEALQNAKKKDEAKIAKAVEEMNIAKGVYESINSELREEMPILFGSRIGCYGTVFQAVASLRDIFYKEMSALNLEFQDIMKDLKSQHPDKVFVIKGLQRSGSLKRRSLMSPKSWKASFSDFHMSYSPRASLRDSTLSPRSPERPSFEEPVQKDMGSQQDLPTERPFPRATDTEEPCMNSQSSMTGEENGEDGLALMSHEVKNKEEEACEKEEKAHKDKDRESPVPGDKESPTDDVDPSRSSDPVKAPKTVCSKPPVVLQSSERDGSENSELADDLYSSSGDSVSHDKEEAAENHDPLRETVM
ncbi:bridging integrator 2a isoform X2 [Denticeps clupeoides]|uniref:bridging integrator 2a isoform X2 n=1 Tax=Denticeps clupeoides TaxID=299321 RepID=UPI0010A2EC87|nr:bridging integrator 2 isoform X2 [Denticeps clupeoides]